VNRLEAIEACNQILFSEPAIIGTHGAGVHRQRADGQCPVHHSDQCVETFYAQSKLAGLSVWELWTLWRSWRKAARP
jgi:hypothetical protein